LLDNAAHFFIGAVHVFPFALDLALIIIIATVALHDIFLLELVIFAIFEIEALLFLGEQFVTSG
jgi:hypothetical protein